jgi:hypothetical protein
MGNPSLEWKPAAFHQYPRSGAKVMGYAVRTDRYHYIEWLDRQSDDCVLARELYDHGQDELENVNVADDPRYAAAVENLHDTLRAGWRAAVPD